MIKIKNLHKSFNSQHVLKGINLDIPEGKITVILGPSGIGKSVLLKLIIGLLKPDKGQVVVDGMDFALLDSEGANNLRKSFGMLFQNAALFDSLTVLDNVRFPLMEHTDFTEEKINQVAHRKLELVGMAEDGYKMPSELSGGMKKRVGLARAIALEPRIILYDEPTTGLDPIMVEAIDNLILDMQKKLDITSVVISHDIKSALKIADKMAMIDNGTIIEEGNPEEFRRSSNPIVQRFINQS